MPAASSALIRRLSVLLTVAGIGSMGAAPSPAPKPAPPVPTPEQKAQIARATKAEELVELGKSFFVQKELGAAAAAIEKACELKPELLLDSKRQSPKSWNDFWFQQRARIAEKKLPKTDAASRVKLAAWLHAGDLTTEARQMLMAAIEIDRTLPEAKALAEQWKLFGGGPVRFDLTLTQPLFAASIMDEGIDLARKDRAFVVIPFQYDPGETRLIINKGLLKAIGDDGKPAMIKGIATLETGGSGGPPGAAAPRFDMKIPANQPLWERVEATVNEDNTGIEIVCLNTVRPIVPRTAGRGAAPPQQLPPDTGREPHPGSGYAAFVIEVPQAMKYVDCEYRGATPVHLEREFLEALAGVPKDLPPADRIKVIEPLTQFSADKQGVVAAAAVAKLGGLRFAVAESGTAALPASVLQKLDAPLVAALGHADRQPRQAAFEALSRATNPLSDDLLKQIRSAKDAAIGMGILDEAEGTLNPPPLVEGAPPPGAPAPAQGLSGPIAEAVAALQPSPASANTFAMLSACLSSGVADVQRRALNVLLASPTQQSVQILAGASGPIRSELVSGFAKIENADFKAALLRALIIRPDAATLPKLLAAAQDVKLVITRETDPFILALSSPASAGAMEQLLALLGQADLSAVASTPGFKRALDSLSSSQQSSAGVKKSLVKLALAGFKAPYEAPIKRSGGARPPEESAFEAMLVSLATSNDRSTSLTATTALLEAGRITALNERLRKGDAKIAQALIQQLSSRKGPLWERESLPAFLASRAGDSDASTQQIALGALLNILKGVDVKQRWRVNMAIKQAIEKQQLVELTASTDERLSQAAITLLSLLVQKKPGETSEFASLPDRGAREAKLNALEQENSSKPAGTFGCVLYIDLKPSSTGGQPGETLEPPRFSVPLQLPNLVLQQRRQNLAVLLEGADITVSQQAGGGGPTRLNAMVLLRAALESPAVEKEKLDGKVDVLAISEKTECELKYEQLGTWSCEIPQVQDDGKPPEPGRTLRVSSAKIVLEPLTY